MLRPQKVNSEVSFNDTLLNFGLCYAANVQNIKFIQLERELYHYKLQTTDSAKKYKCCCKK